MTQRFRIDTPLPGLNEVIDKNRRNRFQGASLKAAVERDIIACIRRAKLKPMKSPVTMRYEWIEASRRRDKDNIASAKKFVQDALVKAEVLAGDGWKHVEGFHDSFTVDAKAPGVIVEMEEVAAP